MWPCWCRALGTKCPNQLTLSLLWPNSSTGSPYENRLDCNTILHVFDCIEIVLGGVEFDQLLDGKVSIFVPPDQVRKILSRII